MGWAVGSVGIDGTIGLGHLAPQDERFGVLILSLRLHVKSKCDDSKLKVNGSLLFFLI